MQAELTVIKKITQTEISIKSLVILEFRYTKILLVKNTNKGKTSTSKCANQNFVDRIF